MRLLPFRSRPIIPADVPVQKAVTELAAAASRQLNAARFHRKAIPRAAFPALLPAIIAQRFLTRLKRAGYDAFDPALVKPDPLQSWRLAAGALLHLF